MRRRKLHFVLIINHLFFFVLTVRPSENAGKKNFAAARAALLSISAKESRSHVHRLASEEFKGRETGTPGEWLAAKYIAKEFSEYGLLPGGDDGTFFQNFQLTRSDLNEATMRMKSDIDGEKTSTVFSVKRDFVPFNFTGEDSVSAAVVFAGYGITAPEYHYDDYQRVDAKGKIVLVLRHEPRENDPESVFAGKQLTKHSLFEQKARNALAHGAVGMLLVSDPASGHVNLEPQGYWPSLYRDRWQPKPWELLQNPELRAFPSLWIDLDVAEKILQPTGRNLNELQKEIDATGKPQSFNIVGQTIAIEIDLDQEIRRTQNVIGFIRGSDPELNEEVVVVGAHFDHIGIINDRIYRGADDNASGTAGLLEIAESFAELVEEPRRSLLFIAFSAEELGLLGSAFYVNHPIAPMEKTVTMINLDMIGRNVENEVTVIGGGRSPDLREINIAANREIGMTLKYGGEHFFNRSDQANFARHNIPVLFYNTADHQDYHRPSDTPEKVNPEKVARIARLAFLVAWEVANSDVRPSVLRPRIGQ